MHLPRRVAVTGMGILSPCGNDAESFFSSLAAGQSGIDYLPSPLREQLPFPAGSVKGFDPAQWDLGCDPGLLDRCTQLAIAAALQAGADAGLDSAGLEGERLGVYFGTGMGASISIEAAYRDYYLHGKKRVHPLTVVKCMNNSPAAHLGIRFNAQGNCLTYSVACASSSVAIGEAFRAIKFGFQDTALCGGSESLLNYGTLKAWEALRALAPVDAERPGASCRPFAADRNGFVLSEGTAMLILEEYEQARRRGARIHGEIVGYGLTNDAGHLTQPSVAGQSRAMRNALRESGLEPGDIDYVNAHGTATHLGDIAETQSIKEVFGDSAGRLPVSSTKSMHGHLLGAAGAAELVATLMAMRHRTLPPTAFLERPDPQCDLDYIPREARRAARIEAALSNSFAFGGVNAVLAVKAARE